MNISISKGFFCILIFALLFVFGVYSWGENHVQEPLRLELKNKVVDSEAQTLEQAALAIRSKSKAVSEVTNDQHNQHNLHNQNDQDDKDDQNNQKNNINDQKTNLPSLKDMKDPKDYIAESQIPLFQINNSTTKKQSEPNVYYRVVLSLILLCLLALAGFIFVKFFAKNKHHLKSSTGSLKILAQHSLGHKKSLIVISVAGEALLVGITEQQITLLKTLSLLDDEIPSNASTNFQKALDDSEEDDDFAMKGLKELLHGSHGRSREA